MQFEYPFSHLLIDSSYHLSFTCFPSSSSFYLTVDFSITLPPATRDLIDVVDDARLSISITFSYSYPEVLKH